MNIPFKGTHRIGSFVATVHLLGVLLTVWYVSIASDSSGQAGMVWAFWIVADLPISFLAYELTNSGIILVHVVLGTIWWYFLAMVLTRLLKGGKPNASSPPS